jgi:hypothetical protein
VIDPTGKYHHHARLALKINTGIGSGPGSAGIQVHAVIGVVKSVNAILVVVSHVSDI